MRKKLQFGGRLIQPHGQRYSGGGTELRDIVINAGDISKRGARPISLARRRSPPTGSQFLEPGANLLVIDAVTAIEIGTRSIEGAFPRFFVFMVENGFRFSHA